MARKRLVWTWKDGDGVEPYQGEEPPDVRRVSPEDLSVVFQPIVDLRTRTSFAVEALARCRLPQFANPSTLFERASAAGFCGRLGRYIRQITFERCPGQPVFVNVHPDELATRWLVRPDDPLCFHDAPVYIEVTEAVAIDHYDLVASALREVTSRTGVMTVIDDFGVGYSNLRRLADLEPVIVKLDRVLIRGLDTRARQRALVRGVVRMCEGIGAEVVAEGIETAAELAAAVEVGCHYGQGYLFARPAYPVSPVRWP